jgi:hypothetical protein
VKNNELTLGAVNIVGTTFVRTIRSCQCRQWPGDSQHSCGEGECSDENGFNFEMHIVIKVKEVCSWEGTFNCCREHSDEGGFK